MSGRHWPFWAVVIALHILPFAVRPALIGGDEPHYALMAHSVAVDGDLDLTDEYREVREGSNAAGRKSAGKELDEHLIQQHGKRFFSHPLGLPVLVAPLLWIQEALAPGASPDLLLVSVSLTVTFGALVAGWRALQRYLCDRRAAALMVFGIYFSTPLWYYSRTFYTEPYIWSFSVLALAAIISNRWFWASLLLGLALAMKETAFLIVVPILAGVAQLLGIRRAIQVAAGPLIAVGLFCFKNYVIYGKVLVAFQPFQLGTPVEGALGLLFGSQHGIIWFAPILFFASAGWLVAGDRSGEWSASTTWSLVIFLAYFGLTATWAGWGGGASYGPRLLVATIPAFVVPLLRLWDLRGGRRWLRGTLWTVLVCGFTVQWCAAIDPVPAMWSIRIGDLLTGQPLGAVSGAVTGVMLLVLLFRYVPSDHAV